MNTRTAIFYFLMISHIALLVWLLRSVWVGKTSLFLGAVFFVGTLFLILNYIRIYGQSSSVLVGPSIEIPMQIGSNSIVTQELIADILGNEYVVATIRNDLMKTGQIGYKEMWRLGLITPDLDRYNPTPDSAPLHARVGKAVKDYDYRLKSMGQIPTKRTAVLYNTTYLKLQFDRLVVTGGSVEPMISGYPGWSYRLSAKLNEREMIRMRNIQVEDHARSSRQRSRFLPAFLKEDGFPLKNFYSDGDPLTADRGGTIIIDRGNAKVIYPRYFVQRRLIDDEGNLVDIGIDENFGHNPDFEVKMQPSVSQLLIQCVSANGFKPVVRYRSFPYASDFKLSLLDTPMSASGWADLHIDTRGKAKLFVAKEKTEAEWIEMMGRLQQLFYQELAKQDYRLLGLTKDKTHLNEYLAKKQSVLLDYFIIQDFSMPLSLKSNIVRFERHHYASEY